MEGYWDAANGHAPHSVKFESEAAVPGFPYCTEPGLNFSTAAAFSEDDTDFAPGRRGKASRQDPLSHRIIEKRRRDRMNSCLADLSRLIPPQYMRKGRGRVEKTEIIEMAIRHLKNLQNQECLSRDTSCVDQYRLGYQECLSEAAKFILSERGEEICYRMVTHLKEHCSETLKGDFLKSRCGGSVTDNVSASSGSPTGAYHHSVPVSHLRDMLTSASDIEHSNDHHDVKDLSFRSNNPPQTPVITSTAPIHSEASNQDFDSSHSSVATNAHNGSVSPSTNQHESVLRTIRMRKFSETSTDVEHNNNSYKFKNYIQQRFSQDTYHHDESMSLDKEEAVVHALTNGTRKRKQSPDPIVVENGMQASNDGKQTSVSFRSSTTNGFSDVVKHEAMTRGSSGGNGSSTNGHHPTGTSGFPIPIFACHTQGFYVPLNVDYEYLLPYLDRLGVDLLNKNFTQISLHPVNINVNYAPPTSSVSNATGTTGSMKATNFVKPKLEGLVNGW